MIETWSMSCRFNNFDPNVKEDIFRIMGKQG